MAYRNDPSEDKLLTHYDLWQYVAAIYTEVYDGDWDLEYPNALQITLTEIKEAQ
jgi:hypothetical protein